MARKKKIHFSFEARYAAVKVWVEYEYFDKILMNIFSNAFKYTPEQGEITFRFLPGAMLPVAIL